MKNGKPAKAYLIVETDKSLLFDKSKFASTVKTGNQLGRVIGVSRKGMTAGSPNWFGRKPVVDVDDYVTFETGQGKILNGRVRTIVCLRPDQVFQVIKSDSRRRLTGNAPVQTTPDFTMDDWHPVQAVW